MRRVGLGTVSPESNRRCAQRSTETNMDWDKNEEMIVELEGSNCRIYGLKEKGKKGNNL